MGRVTYHSWWCDNVGFAEFYAYLLLPAKSRKSGVTGALGFQWIVRESESIRDLNLDVYSLKAKDWKGAIPKDPPLNLSRRMIARIFEENLLWNSIEVVWQ